MTPNIDEFLADIRTWVEIESQTADLDGCARMLNLVEGLYRAVGFAIERVASADGEREHLICRSPDPHDQPGILVLSHVDTVHPRGTLEHFPFKIDGDIAYGPGIYDMKACAYVAMRAIQAGAVGLPVTHLLTTDEETGSLTSSELIVRLAKQAKYVLVTEPAREGGKIVTARKGAARYTVKTIGRPAHSGSRHADGRNAIVELARHALALTELTDYERGTTINVGLIEGGTAVNVVPAEALMRVDHRFVNQAGYDEVRDQIYALKPVDPDIKIEVEGGLDRPPFDAVPGTMALFEHAKAQAAALGWTLEGIHAGGGSDGNFTAEIAPTLDGLGVDGKGGHTLFEQIYISSIIPRYQLFRRLLEYPC